MVHFVLGKVFDSLWHNLCVLLGKFSLLKMAK